MRLIILKLVFVLSSFNCVLAQDTITLYYNNDWNLIKDKNKATYYRKAFPDSNKAWSVRDYYMNNQIQMTGTFKSKKFTTRQGHFIYYFENGRKSSEGNYVNNKNEGLWTYWHENGKKESEGIFKNDLRQDKWASWHDNGQKESEGLFIENKAEDNWESAR